MAKKKTHSQDNSDALTSKEDEDMRNHADRSTTTDKTDIATDKGGVTATGTSSEVTATADPPPARGPDKLAIKHRFEREKRWQSVEPVKTGILQECRARGMSKEESQAFAYAEVDRLYPPLPPPEPEPKSAAITALLPADSGRVQGLGDIPKGWGQLPLNASLQSELGWVQSHRLAIVEEKSSGATVVHLDRARSPAPSMAALGWLETSIRSYAKYVDVVARSLAVVQDEQEHLAREDMAIDEIRGLLREMRDPDSPTCTECGQRLR